MPLPHSPTDCTSSMPPSPLAGVLRSLHAASAPSSHISNSCTSMHTPACFRADLCCIPRRSSACTHACRPQSHSQHDTLHTTRTTHTLRAALTFCTRSLPRSPPLFLLPSRCCAVCQWPFSVLLASSTRSARGAAPGAGSSCSPTSMGRSRASGCITPLCTRARNAVGANPPMVRRRPAAPPDRTGRPCATRRRPGT